MIAFIRLFRRKLRRSCKYRCGVGAFDNRLMGILLGFAKKGKMVSDRSIDGTLISYEWDTEIGDHLFYKGYFEKEECLFFARMIAKKQFPLIFDIGANIGIHTITWARANRHAIVHAFEPSPSTLQILRKNVASNHLNSRVAIVPNAVSSTPGTSAFYVTEDNAYNSLKETRRKGIREKVEVAVTTIDEYAVRNKVDRISLIKIDVEGLEREVIAGGDSTIRRFLPDLFVEIYGGGNSNADPEETIRHLCALGYHAFVWNHGCLVPFVRHSDNRFEYYFTHDSQR